MMISNSQNPFACVVFYKFIRRFNGNDYSQVDLGPRPAHLHSPAIHYERTSPGYDVFSHGIPTYENAGAAGKT